MSINRIPLIIIVCVSLWLYSCPTAFAQSPVLSPTAPVVNQGTTATISCGSNCGAGGGTFSCPGCTGTLSGATSTTVIYHAPATVIPNQSIGGFQLMPNNAVYNIRVDSLPLRSDSATLMAGTGTGSIITREIYDQPINYCNNSTPTKAMLFHYTPGNNGNFQVPAYPAFRVQSGWQSRWDSNRDHHSVCVDTGTGTVQEMYQLFPSLLSTNAVLTGNVVTVTFADNPIVNGLQPGAIVYNSGFTGNFTILNNTAFTITASTANSVSWALTHADIPSAAQAGNVGQFPNDSTNSASGVRYAYSTYNLPANGATDAAGMYLEPYILRIQEYEQAIATGGSIKHAIRFTIGNNHICDTSLANGCYSGQPIGVRHIWPATNEAFSGGGLNPYGMVYRLKAAYNCAALSSTAQILCNAMKQYGIILADGGTDWSLSGESGKWPDAIKAAFKEIESAAIQGSTNFEAVDMLSVQATASQTCPTPNNCSLTNVGPERVIYTRNVDSVTSAVDVALIGVAVTLPNDAIYVQSGTAAQQLSAFVNGGANNTVTWAVSPAITGGSLTAGGLLTPPATIANVTAYTITATSTDNTNIKANMQLTIYPTGSIFIRPGANADFTDTFGNVWTHTGGTGDDLGCCGNLTGGSPPWPNVPNIAEYFFRTLMFSDEFFNFYVNNGTYKITMKLATDQAGPGGTGIAMEAQGTLVYPYVDVNTAAGGNFKPVDFIMNATVNNGLLQIVARQPFASGSTGIINAIQIDLVAGPPTNGIVASPGIVFTPGMVFQ